MLPFAVLLFVFVSALDASGIQNEEDAATMTTASPSTKCLDLDPFCKTYDRVIFTIVSSLSAFGSVAIIVTYFLWRDLQTTTRRILVYISVGDFFATYSALVIFWKKQFNSDEFSCKLQSFVTSTAIMWSFFWTTSLAIYLYIALVKKRHDISEKLMVKFHVINWLLPVILLGAAWHENMLGTTENRSTAGWCWIRIGKNHEKAVVWMLITGKFWEIISYFINGIMYFFIIRTIKKEVSRPFTFEVHLLTELDGAKWH